MKAGSSDKEKRDKLAKAAKPVDDALRIQTTGDLSADDAEGAELIAFPSSHKSGHDGNGQPPSLEDLYRDNYKRVYNYVFYKTLSRDLTEDIVSEAFLKAVRAFDSFDASKASFSTWVCTIARNCMLDYYRRTRPVEDIEEIPEGVFATEDSYDETDETAQLVRKLLAVVDEDDRELINLKYYQGLRNKEIAEVLGINASTIATRLSRAIARMRAAAES